MSWDLYLIQFQNGQNAAIPPQPTMAVMEQYCKGPVKAPFKPFACELADGLRIEVYVGGLDGAEPFHGAMFALRGYNEAAARFIYDFARSGDMTILNTGDPVVLLTEARQLEQLPSDLREGQRDTTVLVDSAASLHAALSGGFKAWRDYRDHVLKDR